MFEITPTEQKASLLRRLTAVVASAALLIAGAEMAQAFNPQPEPPGEILVFEVVGSPDGDLRGSFRDGDVEGELRIETHTALDLGTTVHVVQTWTLAYPPDPVHPPDPVQVALQGILNLASGTIVLNGVAFPPDPIIPPDPVAPGTRAHVRGGFVAEGDTISILGELMFNPQPEPPGLN